MPQRKRVIPLSDQLDLLLKLNELETQGKTAEAVIIKQQIPLPAYMAKWAKDHMGAKFVQGLGWSMAEAEANYGSDWLSR
jgi:hypothetical protein